MNFGTAGTPIDMAMSRDYNAIFSELADAGMNVYFPTTIYEEFPVKRGFGFESDFLPAPFGTATAELYDLAREYGIKISFSADYLFPLDAGPIDPDNSPLQAIIDAGGIDIIHSIANYDEPAWNGVDPSQSQAVYEHVNNVDPDISVIQVHAPVTTDDPAEYLDSVLEHAQWADEVGFDVYPIGTVSGIRTPQRPDQLVSPSEALKDYVDWLQAELGDKKHVMVLQGFERVDLYSDEMQATFTTQDFATSRPPTLLEMREMLIAVDGVDTVIWWGPSLQDTAQGDIWQDILEVTALASSGNLGTAMGALEDIFFGANELDEDADMGSFSGVILNADDPDQIDVVSYSLDDTRFEVAADGRVLVAANATFDFETESMVSIEATAQSTDGTTSIRVFNIEIRDIVDQIVGTAGSDALLGDINDDYISAGSGDDLIDALSGNDRIDAGDGSDFIYGGTGDDTIYAQGGVDVVSAGAGNDWVDGGSGSDFLDGGLNDDLMYGGDGADWLQGNSGADVIYGGIGNDEIRGGRDNDRLFGENGNDTMFGAKGDDSLDGGLDDDLMYGGDGADDVLGNSGADVIYGGDGNDTLRGGQDNDEIHGGNNDDWIKGALGNDTLSGGAGADTFVFTPNFGTDIVLDYELGIDQLSLDDALWGGANLTTAQVISSYARIDGNNNVVLDFGLNEVTLLGVTSTAGLDQDLLIA
jgi:Ca2+-binding RTX toxin-like protein